MLSDSEYVINVEIPEKMKLKNILKELKELPEKYDLKKTSGLVSDLLDDKRIQAMHNAANVMIVNYLKYNDHGRSHAIISARNALKIYLYTYEKIKPNVVLNRGYSLDDGAFIVLMAAFLHDVGNMIHRDFHYFNSVLLSKDLIWEYIEKYYGRDSLDMKWSIFSHIANAIASHDEAVQAFTLEASSVKVGEGCDMTAGRSRKPYSIGKVDIHSVSALSITEVDILKGDDKPLLIKVNMSNPAGVFQVEEVLLMKLNSSILKDHTKIEVTVRGRPIRLSTLKQSIE